MPTTYFDNLDFTVVHVASIILTWRENKRSLKLAETSWDDLCEMWQCNHLNTIDKIGSILKRQPISTHVFTATANPLISRRLREGDGGAECAVNLAPILIALHVYVAENVCILSSLLYRSDNGALFQMLQVFTLNGKGLCLTFCSPCFFMSLKVSP